MTNSTVNATSAALLGLLHDKAMNGGELTRAAETRLGAFWTVTRSQIYRELPVLAGRGFLKASEPGHRGAVLYKLTAKGRRALAAWLAEPAGREQVRNPVVLRTAFAPLMDADALKAMHAEAERHHDQVLTEITEQVAQVSTDGDESLAQALEFATLHHRAVLAWLKGVQ